MPFNLIFSPSAKTDAIERRRSSELGYEGFHFRFHSRDKRYY